MSRVLSSLFLLSLVAGVLAAAPAAEQAKRPAEEQIVIDAKSTDVDYRNETLLFHDVRVRQGPVQVQADKAVATASGSAPNIENAQWTFSGNVRITNEGGNMAAEEARVNFRNSRIASATITGSPASFEQQLDKPPQLARGRAGSIEYDVIAGTVRLLKDAYLTDGSKEIRSETITYSVRDQRLLANAGERHNGRVQIILTPKSNKQETPAPPEEGARK